VGTTAGLSAAASSHIRRPLHVSLRLDLGRYSYIFSHRLMCELFSYSTKCFFIPLGLFTTGIFHLRTGLWLAPFDVSYCVCGIYRDQYLDKPEDFPLLGTYANNSFT
jgi:hypothetical protein